MPAKIEKVLFVYLLIEDKFGCGREKPMLRVAKEAPLGIQYLSAVLRKERNIHTEILDERITPFSPLALAEKINRGKYGLAGFYLCADPELEKKAVHTFEILRKNIEAPIVAGGPSFDTAPILKAGCDIICHSEGERTILQIIDSLEKKIDRSEVKGISYLGPEGEVRAAPQPLIENLDEIPFPTRDKAATMKYSNFGNPNVRRPYMAIAASRGCPMKCAYCSMPEIWEGHHRIRSRDNVLEEIESLVKEYGPCYLAFRDDIFGARPGWTAEFCEKVLEKKLPIHWICNQHPLIPRKNYEELFKLMARAGCDTIHMGVQSADPEILKKINRNPAELELLKEKVALARKAGILTFIDFIFGLPGETEETMRKSIRYTAEVKPALVAYYSLGIFNGTQIEREYGDDRSKITSLTEEQIDRTARMARKKYMLKPRTILYLLGYVIRHNPRFLLSLFRVVPQAVSWLGVGKGACPFD